ncbi:MAG: phosphonopyruvate decarboxylase [bacterium]|jgi:phosphonopyruvate decarboxylase
MIKASQFLDECKKKNFEFFSGTPCSYLKPFINAVIDDPEVNYYDAVNEGDAVALVNGAFLAGKKGVVMFQNSGFGNAVNSLTSLSYSFQIPCLVIVTHRGEPGGKADEPQHELMGQITKELLDTLKIKWDQFPEKEEDIEACLEKADQYMKEHNQPYALVMRHGAVEAQSLKTPKSDAPIGKREYSFSENITKKYAERATRTDALQVVLKNKQENDLVIATTGKTGRELYTLDDADNHLYMVGSMGCASPFALGMAMNLPNHRLIAIDGDAALLMRMGNLATVGKRKPTNLIHLCLDNESNDSTGGQSTISGDVAFAAIANAAGYDHIYSTDELDDLNKIFSELSDLKGAVFIHFRTQIGSPDDLGRPKIKPFEVKERMMNFISK